MTSNNDPCHLIQANKKIKELKQALEVCTKIEEQVSWACDFTNFKFICHTLEPICEAVDNARDDIEREIDYTEQQIEDYYFKRDMFENENAIEL
jgi:hypothetical protein